MSDGFASLIHTKNDKNAYCQPWWKERIRDRYIRSLDSNTTSKFYDGQCWTFLKDGLDDFRDGGPPVVQEDIFIRGDKCVAPSLKGDISCRRRVKQRGGRSNLDKEEICFSKAIPRQQRKLRYIDTIEQELVRHPLALYPHLGHSLPPEMFDDVIDILDPGMRGEAGEEDSSSDTDNGYAYQDDRSDNIAASPPQPQQPVPTSGFESCLRDDDETSTNTPFPEEGHVQNPYRWLPRADEKKDKRRGDKHCPVPVAVHTEDDQIGRVTAEFCSWVSGLGGESNNIEQSTLTSLFASGYETKPALSVPIHVVELTNVPPELRLAASATSLRQDVPSPEYGADSCVSPRGQSSYSPSWVKYKYGAWYLDPKLWKKRPATEPLKDPEKDTRSSEMSESKKKSYNLDFTLAPMHGAKAFMEFVDRRETRKPEFLEHIAEIQQEQQREEARLEAELAKQRKQHEAV